MTRREQRKFIKEHASRVLDDILTDAHKFPEEWDGFELRLLMAEVFARQVQSLDGFRLRKYRNEAMVRNLV